MRRCREGARGAQARGDDRPVARATILLACLCAALRCPSGEEAGGLRGPGGALLGCLVVLTTTKLPCPYILGGAGGAWVVRGWGEGCRELARGSRSNVAVELGEMETLAVALDARG